MKATWDEVIKIVSSKIKETDKDDIAAHVGDIQSLETINAFKSFLEKIGVTNYDFREKPFI